FISATTCARSASSARTTCSSRQLPPWRRTRSASRRTSRTTSSRAGSRHTDCWRYSAPSERSLRHTCTRSVAAAPAVDALTSSQSTGESDVTFVCYTRNYAHCEPPLGKSPSQIEADAATACARVTQLGAGHELTGFLPVPQRHPGAHGCDDERVPQRARPDRFGDPARQAARGAPRRGERRGARCMPGAGLTCRAAADPAGLRWRG